MGILDQAAALIGSPYALYGRDPTGWDCWGCARWVRQAFWQKESPSWAEVYLPLESRDPGLIERLMLERLQAWQPVDLRPGALLSLRIFDRAAHVGVLLEGRDFIHVMRGCFTVVESLDSPRWTGRLVGVYDS